jgi:recombination protein RecA
MSRSSTATSFPHSPEFARGLDGFRHRVSVQIQSTGISELDALLAGGVPRGSLVELCGSPSSGRTSICFSLLAAATKRQEACAYVDVSDSLDPLSLASTGVDLTRLLWIRCGLPGTGNSAQQNQSPSLSFSSKNGQTDTRPILRNAPRKPNRTQTWTHPRDQIRGIESALPSIVRHAEEAKNEIDAQMIRPMVLPFPKSSGTPSISSSSDDASKKSNAVFNGKPWKRLEQALKATDLLLHSGGWGIVIFDLGSISWVDARRIELSTWFRFRRTIENTPTILVLLLEESCAKSCSSLVLHCQRKNENWSHLNSRDRSSGISTLDGFEIEGKILSSRNGLQPMGSARWTMNTLCIDCL